MRAVLGILDNYHDFKSLDDLYLKTYKNFYLELLRNQGFRLSSEPFTLSNLKDIFKTTFSKINVDSKKIRDSLFRYFLDNFPRPHIPLSEIHRIIIENFNRIFNIKIEGTFSSYISELFTDDEKISLRMPLYHLIKNLKTGGDVSDILIFFIKYLNLEILNDDIKNQIKNKIIQNALRIRDNKTYPTTYIDDMTSGLNNQRLYAYKLINIDKLKIDEARTEGIVKYFTNYDKGKNYQGLFINNNNSSLGLKINKRTDGVYFLGSYTYIDENYLIVEFDGITFSFNKNSVGRGETFGLKQVIDLLLKYYKTTHTRITTLRFNDVVEPVLLLKSKMKKFDDTIKKVSEIFHNILTRTYDKSYFIDKYYEYYSDVLSDSNYSLLLIELSELKALISKYNRMILTGYDNYTDFLKIKKYILSILKKMKETNLIKIYKIINNTVLIKLINILDDINISDFEFKKHLLFPNNESDYDDNLKHLLYFIHEFEKLSKDNLIKILNIDELYIEFNKIYQKYGNNFEKVSGLIMFILFNAKRFADWIQAELAKKYYLMLQTKDHFLEFYLYLIGAPIILDNIIYNFEPQGDISSIFASMVKIDRNKSESTFNVDNPLDKLLYTGIKTIKLPKISRNYFDKYIKYKTKYELLKKNIRV